MTWVDVAGRCLIIGLGEAAGIYILAYVWAWVLRFVLDVWNVTDNVISYAHSRKEFKEWREEKNAKYKLSPEEEEEFSKIHGKSDKEDDE